MREIKFRAYHKVENKMYEVFSFCDKIIKTVVGIGTAMKMPIEDFKPLMQFTGLKDKKGVNIYEGDICNLEIKGYNIKPFSIPFLIVFNVDGFQGCNLKKKKFDYLNSEYLQSPRRFNYKEWKNLEVIGNIHENPELLCQKE